MSAPDNAVGAAVAPHAAARRIDLLIAGAQKAGTTALFRYLAEHPDVAVHAQREMGYFLHPEDHGRDRARAMAAFFPDARVGQRLVAKHALLMYSEEAVRLAAVDAPEARIVVTLRDPVARAYSAYWYARRRGWETAGTFEEALKLEAERIARDGWYRWRNCAYVLNGDYPAHLRRLHAAFGVDRVRVVLSSDLDDAPAATVTSILDDIGIEPAGFDLGGRERHNQAAQARSEVLSRMLARGLELRRVRRFLRSLLPAGFGYRLRYRLMKMNEKSGSLPPIRPETELALRARLASSVQETARLIGRDLTAWLPVPESR